LNNINLISLLTLRYLLIITHFCLESVPDVYTDIL
jgi:hypothetical protein